MNKEIIELKNERAEAIKGMNAINALCKEEKRVKSEDEAKAWTNHETKIEEMDTRIAEAERLDALNRSIAIETPAKKEDKKLAKRYSLAKAIKGLKTNSLDGLEKEMHDEAMRTFGTTSEGLLIPEFLWNKEARADYTYAGQTTDYDSLVTDLDITTDPSVYAKLGVTVWGGLKSKTTLNFSDGHDAAFPGEGTTVAESTPTRATAVLDPRRVGGKKGFSNELLSVSKVMASEFSDMIASIDRALSKEVLAQAVVANIESGFATSDTAAALTYAEAIKMQSSLETDTFSRSGYAMSKPLYHKAQTIAVDSGSGLFAVDKDSKIGGFAALGSTQLPIHDSTRYDIIFGDWSRAYIGFFGSAMELLIDPYTDAAIGVTNIIFNRLADIVVNPARFISHRNKTA